ncbi:MAG: trypsin-like serine protease [Firmicutes bacterium]|nr:trypsin-like serine protease [Bacillota bacterium]
MSTIKFERSSSRIGLFTLLLAAAFMGAFLVLLAVKYTGLGQALVVPPVVQQEETLPAPQSPGSMTDYERATVQVVDKVGPSVVMITTTSMVEVKDFFFGLVGYQPVQGLGSGVIFREDGHILTNYHVIAEAEEILVVLNDGRKVAAKLIGGDPDNDLAVLKIEGKGYPVAQFGRSADLKVGQMAIAIGNPIGESLNNTVTVGVISALGRNIATGRESSLRDLIQTDASINPGNSGGPLLNSEGKVIGINTAIIEEAQGIGFAIPIDKAQEIADLIIKGELRRPGAIGITYLPFDASNKSLIEQRFRIKLPVDQGFLITQVASGPAAKAGIKAGDVVISINGQEITQGANFVGLDLKVGDKVTMEIIRNNRKYKVEVIAGPIR